jgi:phage terminase small subunit
MAKQHEIAEKDYILGMSYNDIAAKYNVSIDTVKSWKRRYKWERDKPIKAIQKNAHNAHKNKKVCKSVQSEQVEELNDKEQLFCYHYVRTWNATQAALLAGYGDGNKASANVLGCRLMQRPRVKQEIERLRELFRQEIHVDIQDFLAFCMKIVGADVGDYVTFGQKEVPVMTMFGPATDPLTGEPLTKMVNYVDLGEGSQLDTSVIQEVKQGKNGVSIKLADKKWAWEQLIKYFDWLPDKWQRSIEEEKLAMERKKAEVDKDEVKNVNVIFNIPRPPKGDADV